MQNSEIISLTDVSFAYEKENILENLSLKIYKGDFVGIIGINGAGKSTLIKLILGQLKPDKGSILVKGSKIDKPSETKNIGYVSQTAVGNRANFPAKVSEIVMLNLYSQIGRFRFPKKQHRNIAKNALELVGMQECEDRMIGKLSGGQQQRVMIAKALVNNPDILIMDEPTTGVDKETTIQLFELLKHLNKMHNITIVLISHDIDILEKNTNRVIELKNKKAVEKG